VNQAAGVDACRVIAARLFCSACHSAVKLLAASGKRPHPLPGTGMTGSSLSSMDQAQIVRICLPEQAPKNRNARLSADLARVVAEGRGRSVTDWSAFRLGGRGWFSPANAVGLAREAVRGWRSGRW